MNVPLEVKKHIEAEEFEQAIRLLSPRAEQGDADAQFLLGYLHFTGAEVDPAWAKAWLQKAAEQNHPEACYSLSYWLDDTHSGLPRDTAGWKLLHRAAELGSSEAQYDLGALYATGDHGLPLDAAQSRTWYTRAAEQGNVDAQYNLGLMWLRGEGGPVDFRLGLDWLTRAASRDEPAAMSTSAASILAEAYAHGSYGVERNSATAGRWKQREEELAQRPFRSHPDWFYEAVS